MADIHYHPPGPVGRAFLKSDAFVKGIKGPIGSGKSTVCIMNLVKNAQNQRPGPDGIRRRRTAIIRNTYAELRTTTIKTWHQWVPANQGHWREVAPPTHMIKDKNFEWEIIFIALDRPDDVRKLLSLELSDALINEAREVPRAVLDGLTGRVGRFPSALLGGCTDPCILMDTNPPDTDHWWYRMAADPTPEDMEINTALEIELRKLGTLRPNQKLFEWFDQPGGMHEDAENLMWLEQTQESLKLPMEERRARGRSYYLKVTANKTDEWKKVYVDAQYGFVLDGKPVYPEYRDNVHCREFASNPRLPLHLGLDFGLTPAAVFSQQMPNGQWRKHSEIVTERAGIAGFARLIKERLANMYPGYVIGSITGDPSGNQGQGGDEDVRNVFQILEANGIVAKPSSTNSPTLRIESVKAAMTRMIDGEPGMLIHTQCRVLRKGYNGGYHYKRVQVSGDEKFRDEPDKNIYSHVCDADQYAALGGGEGKAIIRREPVANRPAYAISDYHIE